MPLIPYRGEGMRTVFGSTVLLWACTLLSAFVHCSCAVGLSGPLADLGILSESGQKPCCQSLLTHRVLTAVHLNLLQM